VNVRGSPTIRRTLVGALAGSSASYLLVMAHEKHAVMLSVIVGVLYAAAIRPVLHAYADSVMTGTALGIPAWIFFEVIAFPLSAGRMPQWTNSEMRPLFPS
jgi:uncharacterized membrane protein YagU involved in acid resistance